MGAARQPPHRHEPPYTSLKGSPLETRGSGQPLPWAAVHHPPTGLAPSKLPMSIGCQREANTERATTSSAWGVPSSPGVPPNCLCPEQCLEVCRAGAVPSGSPWQRATGLRLGVHSPLLSAPGLLLPCQGPQLFLRRVLVSEETEGKQRPSGKPGHGGDQRGEPQKLRLQRGDWP